MTDVRPFPFFQSMDFDSVDLDCMDMDSMDFESMDFERMDFESNRSVRRGADRTMRTAIPRRFEEL